MGEEGRERRRFVRHEVRLVVDLAVGERAFRLTSENISLGGIFLATQGEMPEVNSLIPLRVHLEEKGQPPQVIPVTGAVTYHIEGKGFGVEFQWWSEEEQAERARLARYLEEAGLASDEVGNVLGAAASEAVEVE